ncbi:transposase domain-containing protein [Enterococcus faecium]
MIFQVYIIQKKFQRPVNYQFKRVTGKFLVLIFPLLITSTRYKYNYNRGERSIKPFVIGRKAWLFATSQKGAKASAIIYSIVETAKENQLDPLKYLTYVLEQLPLIDLTDEAALDALMPWSDAIPTNCYVPKQTS